MDANKIIKNQNLGKVLDYEIKASNSSKIFLDNGETFEITIHFENQNWSVTYYYWNPDEIIVILKKAGFSDAKKKYLDKIITPLFSDEEKKLILDSKLFYIVIGIK